VVERVGRCRLIDDVLVATTVDKEDLKIVSLCANKGIRVFCGSLEDVLDRYYQAARCFKPDNVIRITSDCPLHDWKVIDMVIQQHMEMGNDYTSNTLEDTFPDGLDCEVMTFEALKQAWYNAKLASEREHVTPFIKKGEQFKKFSVTDSENHADYRWTIDTEKDYQFIKRVYDELYDKNPMFESKDVYQLLRKFPDIVDLNKGIIRNEGYMKSIINDKIIKE